MTSGLAGRRSMFSIYTHSAFSSLWQNVVMSISEAEGVMGMEGKEHLTAADRTGDQLRHWDWN